MNGILAMSNEQFFVNKRPSKKGEPKNSWTVHRKKDCSTGRKNPKNWQDFSTEKLSSLANKQSLGACRKCWGDEAQDKTDELQQLLKNK